MGGTVSARVSRPRRDVRPKVSPFAGRETFGWQRGSVRDRPQQRSAAWRQMVGTGSARVSRRQVRRGSPDPAETSDRRSPRSLAGRPSVGSVARSETGHNRGWQRGSVRDRPQQRPATTATGHNSRGDSACQTLRQKSSRKDCVPGGRRTLTFPGAIGRFPRRAPCAPHSGVRRWQRIYSVTEASRPLPCRRWFASWPAGKPALRNSLCRPTRVDRCSLIHDSLGPTTSLWQPQRSGDAEDMTFPFSGQGRFLARPRNRERSQKMGDRCGVKDEG